MNLIEPANVEWLRVLCVLSNTKRCSKRLFAFSLRANTNFLSHSDIWAYRICIDIGVGAHYVISASTPRRIGLTETMKRSLAPALHQYRSAMRRAPSIRQDRTEQDTAERSEQATRAGAGDLQLSDSVCRDHWRVGVTCRPVWVTCRRERREVSFGGTWDENRFV